MYSDEICSIDDCEKHVFGRGWCRMHWNRWRRHGDPLHRRQIQGDSAARIRSRIEVQLNGCWHWRGQRNENGYGRILHRRRKTYAHRASFEVFVGPIPDGLDVGHKCHDVDPNCAGGPSCLHRRCVNPDHLELQAPRLNRGQANVRRAR